MRPTVFLGHTTEDGSGWSDRDRELARAVQLYEAELCGGCGHPTSETSDPDREGWYDAHEVICAACQAVEKEYASRKGRNEPGLRLMPVLNPNYQPNRV